MYPSTIWGGQFPPPGRYQAAGVKKATIERRNPLNWTDDRLCMGWVRSLPYEATAQPQGGCEWDLKYGWKL